MLGPLGERLVVGLSVYLCVLQCKNTKTTAHPPLMAGFEYRLHVQSARHTTLCSGQRVVFLTPKYV